MNISIELFDIFVISETVEHIIVVGFPHVNNIKGALYIIWCGVNRLGDSGVKVV